MRLAAPSTFRPQQGRACQSSPAQGTARCGRPGLQQLLPHTHLLGGYLEPRAQRIPGPRGASTRSTAGRRVGGALGQACGLTGVRREGGGRGGAARSQRQKPPPGIWVSGLSRARSSSRPSSPSIADGKEEQTFRLWDQGAPRTYPKKLRGRGDCLLGPASPARRTSRPTHLTIRSVCPRGHSASSLHPGNWPSAGHPPAAEAPNAPTLPAPCFPGTFLLVSPRRPRASAPSPAVPGLWGTHPFAPPHRGATSTAQLLLSWAPHGDRWPREGPHPRSLTGGPSAISDRTSMWASARGQGHGTMAGAGKGRH